MFAVITTGGKQYKVMAGNMLEIERLSQNDGDSVVFDRVLLVVDGDSVTFGKPVVDGATVTAKIIENFKGEKIRVSKFKAKSKYRRVTGHRQLLTRVQIGEIKLKESGSKKQESEDKTVLRQVRDKKTVKKSAPKKS